MTQKKHSDITETQSCKTGVTGSAVYKILNLYACLGGNRYKWDEVAKEKGIQIEVTAVELDEELAKLYQERFPNDKVIVVDAHQYLLDHYKEFDFIWTSPPCPSHSRVRFSQKNRENCDAVYPDFKLYEEVVLLDNYFNGKYVVENVIPFYEPLIHAKKRGRHLYWTNFNLPTDIGERDGSGIISKAKNEVDVLCKFHDYDFHKYKGKQRKDKIARNLVDYEAGRTIFETVLGIEKKSNVNQVSIFDTIT
jgi:DNA (cytosine-5)-methyltransferase 1